MHKNGAHWEAILLMLLQVSGISGIARFTLWHVLHEPPQQVSKHEAHYPGPTIPGQ